MDGIADSFAAGVEPAISTTMLGGCNNVFVIRQ